MNNIDEVFVIQDSGIPLFHWSRSDEDNESDDYILQSSLFQALAAFAKEMAQDEIKFVIFENKSFAIKNIANHRMKLVFGHFSPNVDLKESEKYIHGTSGYISGFMTGNYPEGLNDFIETETKHFSTNMKDHLIKENIIPSPEADKIISDEENRQRIQGFLFKSLGYKPGQCNIGPQERQRRLLTGFGFGALSLLMLIGIVFLERALVDLSETLRYLRLVIVFPTFSVLSRFISIFLQVLCHKRIEEPVQYEIRR